MISETIVPEYVAILEDDAGRITEMRECLAALLPGYQHVFFGNANDMVAWLRDHLADIVLVSLDHDLPLHATRNDVEMDCGDGRVVANSLATIAPTCPVIVHSSNIACAEGMIRVLRDAGWPLRRVYPCDDDVWVRLAWADEVQKYIRSGFIHA
jgi:hypothetical protein